MAQKTPQLEEVRELTLGLFDFVAVLLIVTAFAGLAKYHAHHAGFSRWLKPNARSHLGGEYDEVARALRNGRGFADPFREPTGPTAWVPPILPCILAGLYWVTGDSRSSVVEIVCLLQFCVIIFTGLVVIWQARRLRRPACGYLVLVGGLAADFYWLFQVTHDVWLVLLVVDLLWLGATSIRQSRSSVLLAGYWGLSGGLTALCSPIVGAAWAACTVSIWVPCNRGALCRSKPGLQRTAPSLLIAAVVSMLVVAPWIVRNRVVLGRWIPIKSNAMHELWQSQCVDDDGVIDIWTHAQHPWPSAGTQRQRYVAVGEVEFVAECGAAAIGSVAAEPLGFFNRVANRSFASFVAYQAYIPADEQRVWPMRLQRLAFPLPFVSLIGILVLRIQPLNGEVLLTALIYLLVLLPYVVIGYYDRYAAPLLGVKMLLVLYGADSAMAAWQSGTKGLERWKTSHLGLTRLASRSLS